MDRYILDGQYGKYLEMIGVRVGEALRAAGVPEDLFSHKKPVLDEAAYYRFVEAVGGQITDPQLPRQITLKAFRHRYLLLTAVKTGKPVWNVCPGTSASSRQ